MKKCIVFASYIPTPDKLFVGIELLNKFVESFSEYDIYIGINNSCQEWYDCIEEYSKKLNIFSETTPEHLIIDSDASAFQSALRLLKSTGNKYEIYWFGHTKGATSGSHGIRKMISDIFWDKKKIIEQKIIEEGFSIYSPYMGVTSVKNYMNTTLTLFINGYENNDLSSYFTFWVHNGDVINRFLDESKDIFYNNKLIDFKTTDGNNYLDRYFFERDFPMVYQKVIKTPKILYHSLLIHNDEEKKYVIDKCERITF